MSNRTFRKIVGAVLVLVGFGGYIVNLGIDDEIRKYRVASVKSAEEDPEFFGGKEKQDTITVTADYTGKWFRGKGE